MSLAGSAERGFEAWGRLVVRRPLLTIASALLGALALSAQMPGLQINNSQEAMLRPGDPALTDLQRFRAQFPRENIVLLSVQHPDVFDRAFLHRLRAFHEDLEERLPHLEEVSSLVNARITYGTEDELVVESIEELWPLDDTELLAVRERILSNPLYRGALVSADGRFTSIAAVRERTELSGPLGDLDGFDAPVDVLQPADSRGDQKKAKEFVAAVHAIAADHRAADFPIDVSGIPILNWKLGRIMQRDMAIFASASILAIGALLFAVFRRWSGTLLPLLVVALSATSTLGLIQLARVPLSLITEILPSFLLVVGVCDSVHLLVIFYQRLDSGRPRQLAIVDALGHSGLPILMTSVTTAAGLASFVTADLAPMMQLGLFAPAGVMIAFALTVTLLPAVLALVPVRAAEGRTAGSDAWTDRLLGWIGRIATRRPGWVVGASAVLLVVGLAGAAQLRVTFDPISWFPEDDALRAATDVVDRKLGGSTGLELVLDARRRNAFHEPALLRTMDELQQRIPRLRGSGVGVQTATSISSIVKEVNRALNENRQEAYAIPGSRELVAQELLLFESNGREDLAKVADTQLSLGRLSLRSSHADAVHYLGLLEQIEEVVAEVVGSRAEVTTTGSMSLMARATIHAGTSMVRSYLIAILAIAPLVVLMVGNVRMGLIAMIPNLAPIVLTLGVMYWAAIPLDLMSLLIGSIVLGLAVDDTIHFVHTFRRRLAVTRDGPAAIRETLRTTGVAMLVTSTILATGFLMYTLSYLANVRYFGFLVGFATVSAFLADVLLGAALLSLRQPARAAIRAEPSAADTA